MEQSIWQQLIRLLWAPKPRSVHPSNPSDCGLTGNMAWAAQTFSHGIKNGSSRDWAFTWGSWLHDMTDTVAMCSWNDEEAGQQRPEVRAERKLGFETTPLSQQLSELLTQFTGSSSAWKSCGMRRASRLRNGSHTLGFYLHYLSSLLLYSIRIPSFSPCYGWKPEVQRTYLIFLKLESL